MKEPERNPDTFYIEAQGSRETVHWRRCFTVKKSKANEGLPHAERSQGQQELELEVKPMSAIGTGQSQCEKTPLFFCSLCCSPKPCLSLLPTTALWNMRDQQPIPFDKYPGQGNWLSMTKRRQIIIMTKSICSIMWRTLSKHWPKCFRNLLYITA